MSVITINGRRIEVQGSNVSVVNGVASVDGVVVESGLYGVVKVEWEGPLANLQSDASVTCGNVNGSVNAGGSVNCRDIQAPANAGGSIHAQNIYGNVIAGGSVHYTRR
jgi:hypothetical protein